MYSESHLNGDPLEYFHILIIFNYCFYEFSVVVFFIFSGLLLCNVTEDITSIFSFV